MTLYEIPTSSQNTSYSQVVTLSGKPYTLSLRYNTRMRRWILDIADATGVAIVSGLVMLALRNLAGQYATLPLPPGALFCYNARSLYQEPTLSSFLTDTVFFYNDPSA